MCLIVLIKSSILNPFSSILYDNKPYSKMAVALDDLGRLARERGIEGHDSMFTCGSDLVRNMPQNCCVPGCKKNVYVEDGVKISFRKFPEDRERFRKRIVAIRRDVGKEFRLTDHTRVCSRRLSRITYRP